MAGKANTKKASGTSRSNGKNSPKVSVVSGSGDSSSKLDKLIHERTRLAIVSALATSRSLSFNELKSQLGASDGNLSTHARKLEDAGYIRCKKQFKDRMPQTQYALTATGKKALSNYIRHMEALIEAVKQS